MSSDRLTGLDASFLHLEDGCAHMHVASVMLFEGPPPPYDHMLEQIERRLGLVPRYRQRLAFVPLAQGRPKWVDDPHLNPLYLAGRRLLDPFPMVPLAENQALGVALLSYAGRINFGLVGDFGTMWDLDDFAADLEASLAEIAAAAGLEPRAPSEPAREREGVRA